MTGPPGTGKTLLAKAAAQYTHSAFIAASGSEFVEMYVGVGAGRIRDLFKEARQQAVKLKRNSAIIFIDEIDGIGGKRDGGQHREYDQTLNQLLTEMDGVQGDENVRVLIDRRDEPQRIARSRFASSGPFRSSDSSRSCRTRSAREHILKLHARNKPIGEDVSLTKVAEQTFGFSGRAARKRHERSRDLRDAGRGRSVARSHLTQAIDKVMMGERMDRETNSEERERVAIHELGHAIVARTVRPESVAQVSLTPRGQALGYVRHHPQQDRYLVHADRTRGANHDRSWAEPSRKKFSTAAAARDRAEISSKRRIS